MLKKYLSGVCVLFIALTSCLGDSNESIELLLQPAVVDFTPEQMIYIRNNEIIEPTNTLNITGSNGDCFLMSFEVDLGSKDIPENSTSAYFKADIIGNPVEVDKYPVESILQDTSTVLTREQTITSLDKRYAVIRDQLFLYLNHTIVDSIAIDNTYNLSFNTSQTHERDTVVDAVVYEMFLRAIKTEKEDVKTRDSKLVEPVAFSVSDFRRTFSQRETKNDSIYFRIVYAKSFDRDVTSINWAESDIYRMAVE